MLATTICWCRNSAVCYFSSHHRLARDFGFSGTHNRTLPVFYSCFIYMEHTNQLFDFGFRYLFMCAFQYCYSILSSITTAQYECVYFSQKCYGVYAQILYFNNDNVLSSTNIPILYKPKKIILALQIYIRQLSNLIAFILSHFSPSQIEIPIEYSI